MPRVEPPVLGVAFCERFPKEVVAEMSRSIADLPRAILCPKVRGGVRRSRFENPEKTRSNGP